MRYLTMAAFGLGLITLSTWALASRGNAKAGEVSPKVLLNWEYHCVLPPMSVPVEGEGDHGTTGHPAVGVLNHLGSQGWELAAIDARNGHYCFKRPVQ
ncbi:MAG: hypothetical protein AAB426_09895 [Myxococcota bacterium]